MRYNLFLLLFVIGVIYSCNGENEDPFEINFAHLDYLYEEVSQNNEDMAFIHIYSNYPTYNYIDDDDEGTACVDDVARAAIFYLNNFKYTGNKSSLDKNKKLLKFILYLQAENGYFYNFIWNRNAVGSTD